VRRSSIALYYGAAIVHRSLKGSFLGAKRAL
jgi:hypothetical protein